MIRLVTPALLVAFAACTPAVIPPATAPASMPITVGKTMGAPAPASGAVTRTTVYQNSRTVAQVLRLAPNSVIALHHHPYYDESFVVTQGRITLDLDGKTYEIGAGEFIVMPAGTIITGRNSGTTEAAVVVTFSSTGVSGPLTVATTN